MTNGETGTPQERQESRERLKEMRTGLGEAEMTLRLDSEIPGNERQKQLAEINRLNAEINVELGRINDAAIAARDDDPGVQRLVQDLDGAYDAFVQARAQMQEATARAQEAVAVIGKVDKVLKVFAEIALKLA